MTVDDYCWVTRLQGQIDFAVSYNAIEHALQRSLAYSQPLPPDWQARQRCLLQQSSVGPCPSPGQKMVAENNCVVSCHHQQGRQGLNFGWVKFSFAGGGPL